MRAIARLSPVALLLACASGCNEPTYLKPERALETMQQMGGGYADDELGYTIPIRKPSAGEQTALTDEQMAKGLPQQVSWVGVRDLAVEIQLSVTNLDANPARVLVSLLGGNEFGEYDPTLYYNVKDPEAAPPPPLVTTPPIHLQPGQTQNLVFREDQLAEAALDFEAILRYPSTPPMSTPFKVLNARSDVSRVGLEAVPANDVIPQLIILKPHLSADGHVTAAWVVRVRDLGGRLGVPGGSDNYR